MGHKVLVGYATWAGSTAEVAEAVGEILHRSAVSVDIRPLEGVAEVGAYNGFMLGTGIHAGRVHKHFSAFIRRHRAVLAAKPVAYFVVCLTMKKDTEENRCKAEAFLDRVRQDAPDVLPISVGLFGGALRAEGEGYARLSLPLRLVIKAMSKEHGDYRDWAAVRSWAESLVPALSAPDVSSPSVEE